MAKPQLLRLKFCPDPHNPLVSEWPELPREVFRDRVSAEAAAKDFAGRWSAGGYDPSDDSWWAREDLGEHHRLTKFVIAD